MIEADASRFQRIEGAEVEWSEEQLARRAIKDYVDALESENAPINPDRKPKAMSPTDPTAAWTTRGRHKVTSTCPSRLIAPRGCSSKGPREFP